MPDQPSNPQRQANEPESSASRILTFQLQEISGQVQEQLASNTPVRSFTDLAKGLEIVSTTLEVFSGLMKPEEVNELKGRIAALQTDLRNSIKVFLPLEKRISEAGADIRREVEALDSVLNNLLAPFPSPDAAKSSPEFQGVMGPIFDRFEKVTKAMHSLQSDFLDELPVSKIKKRLNEMRERGQKMDLQDLALYKKTQSDGGKFGLRMMESYSRVYAEVGEDFQVAAKFSRRLIAFRKPSRRQGL